ncbi:MAG: phosphatidate cytidylyltransferase [Candidatus Gracilibacteria bacterium]|jgi:dolichol kinase
MFRRHIARELVRKTFHLSGILILVGYTLILNYFSERVAMLSMTALFLILLEIEYVRLEHKPRIAEVISGFLRRHEKTRISSAVFLVAACIISFAAFDYWVAFLAVSMTVFGDLVAAVMGKFFGKTKLYMNKSVVGTLSGLTANMVVGILSLPELLILFAPMAVVATFVEVFTRKMDDNLTVPLFSGFLGQMIVLYFGLNLPPIQFTFLGLSS